MKNILKKELKNFNKQFAFVERKSNKLKMNLRLQKTKTKKTMLSLKEKKMKTNFIKL